MTASVVLGDDGRPEAQQDIETVREGKD